MQKSIINPWKWQDNLGFSQAIEIKNNKGTLYCSGQAAMDADGRPVAGSMEDQIKLSLKNVEEVIRQAGYHPSEIVRLNFFTTSIAEFFAAYGAATSWMQERNIRPSSTLVQVGALAFPGLSIEIEATVVS